MQSRDRLIPAGLGLLAFLAVLTTLGHPGITIDEPLDVRPGRTYVQALGKQGLRFFGPASVRAVFADNAEHPPLGRWLLGIASVLGEPFEGYLGGADPYGVHAGRLAPAASFGLLVGLVAGSALRHGGRVAGIGAGLALILMPRMFAHAHFAALDTFVALFWVAAFLSADRAIGSRNPGPMMALAGIVWALALLTKIHGWLLPPLVGLYGLARLGPKRAILPFGLWLTVGLAIFIAGWPWLWYEAGTRLRAYLATGTDRIALHTLYFGKIFDDRDVPWHYPWFYFATTVPVGLHLFGIFGLGWALKLRHGWGLRLAGGILMFLILFSTRIPVYDGERLFLAAFPLWAMLIGLGLAWLWDLANRRWLRAGIIILVAGQGYGVVALHPFGLSYYNALVGGLPGAERLGLELTFWSDAIDATLLDELARVASPGDVTSVVPTLHHIQPGSMMTAKLLERRIRLEPQEARDRARWLLISRRTAYWPGGMAEELEGRRPIGLRSRQGVWLSGIWPGPEMN
ncbi:MAG: 4-amino-4-deoxy-L-arabinose transferase [Isosphaeraceae bacterium]